MVLNISTIIYPIIGCLGNTACIRSNTLMMLYSLSDDHCIAFETYICTTIDNRMIDCVLQVYI